MVRRSFLTAAIMLLGVLLAPAIPAAGAADPTAMISNLGSRALEVLGKDATQSQRVERFRQLLRADFDVPGIARFVLGRYWNTATEEQRAEFTKLFEDYIAVAYATRLAEYTGETFKVTGSRPEADGAIVSSQIVRPAGAAPVKVDWRLTDAMALTRSAMYRSTASAWPSHNARSSPLSSSTMAGKCRVSSPCCATRPPVPRRASSVPR